MGTRRRTLPADRARRGAAGLLLVLPLALSGCGGPDGSGAAGDAANGVAKLSAAKILQRAESAFAAADYVRIQANGVDEDGGDVASDVRTARNGTCTGHADFGADGGMRIVRHGKELWVRPSGDVASRVRDAHGRPVPHGSWAHGTTGNPLLAQAALVCGRVALGGGGATGAPVKHGTATVDGRRAIEVDRPVGHGAVKVWVAVTGEPVPLKAVATGATSGTYSYSEYGKGFDAKKPPASETVEAGGVTSGEQG